MEKRWKQSMKKMRLKIKLIFFGYNCISNVNLKIVQPEINKKIKNFQKIKNLDELEAKMKEVNDDKLKVSLRNFLKAYNEKND